MKPLKKLENLISKNQRGSVNYNDETIYFDGKNTISLNNEDYTIPVIEVLDKLEREFMYSLSGKSIIITLI